MRIGLAFYASSGPVRLDAESVHITDHRPVIGIDVLSSVHTDNAFGIVQGVFFSSNITDVLGIVAFLLHDKRCRIGTFDLSQKLVCFLLISCDIRIKPFLGFSEFGIL